MANAVLPRCWRAHSACTKSLRCPAAGPEQGGAAAAARHACFVAKSSRPQPARSVLSSGKPTYTRRCLWNPGRMVEMTIRRKPTSLGGGSAADAFPADARFLCQHPSRRGCGSSLHPCLAPNQVAGPSQQALHVGRSPLGPKWAVPGTQLCHQAQHAAMQRLRRICVRVQLRLQRRGLLLCRLGRLSRRFPALLRLGVSLRGGLCKSAQLGRTVKLSGAGS